jgi:hypothetical protein
MFMPNFSSPASTQTDLDFLHFFNKIQNFLEELLSEFKKIHICVGSLMLQLAKHVHAKFQLSSFYPDGQIFVIEHRKRHLLRKFEPSSIFTKISKVIFFYSRVCSKNFKNSKF